MVDLERIKAETVAYFRALDEAATQRHHFRHVEEDGGLWYIESVPDRGELVVIKHPDLTPAGQLQRYSWQHLEDDQGGLADQAIEPEEDPLEAVPKEAPKGCGLGKRAGLHDLHTSLRLRLCPRLRVRFDMFMDANAAKKGNRMFRMR